MTTMLQRTLKLAVHAVATPLICAAGAANADPGGWYAGFASHEAETTVDIGSGWLVGPGADGIELAGGYRVSDHFAVDFGLLRSTGLAWEGGFFGLSPGFSRVETVFDATALQVGAVGILPFGRVWEASIKGGYAYADLSGHQTVGLWNGPSFDREVSANSTRFLFGLGIGVNVARNWHIRMDIESFYIASDWLGVAADTTIDSWSFGAEYRFGRRPARRASGLASSASSSTAPSHRRSAL